MNKIIFCNKCNKKRKMEEVYIVIPDDRIKMLQGMKCGYLIDYYGEFKKRHPKTISQMIIGENYKELSTKGCVT